MYITNKLIFIKTFQIEGILHENNTFYLLSSFNPPSVLCLFISSVTNLIEKGAKTFKYQIVRQRDSKAQNCEEQRDFILESGEDRKISFNVLFEHFKTIHRIL